MELTNGPIRLETKDAGLSARILTVLIPTRNEAGNIARLLSRIAEAMGSGLARVLFVDESRDD